MTLRGAAKSKSRQCLNKHLARRLDIDAEIQRLEALAADTARQLDAFHRERSVNESQVNLYTMRLRGESKP